MSIKRSILDSVRRLFTRKPLESLWLSLFRGTEYGGFGSRFLPGPHLYEPEQFRRVTRFGSEFSLDPSCLMQWYVFWEFKEAQRDRLYSLISPGDTVFDVGTNLGETLLGFARIVGPSGHVYGFEPDPVNHATAVRNIVLNDYGNITLSQVGVGEARTRQKLFRVEPNNRGMNRILPKAEQDDSIDHTEIEIVTIDEFVAERGIDRIDLIKIDIEGYEASAIRGAENVLATLRPKLFIELGYSRVIANGSHPDEILDSLRALGYVIYDAESGRQMLSGEDLSHLGDGGMDIYAIAK